MANERRAYLKTVLGAGALGVGTVLAAKCGLAGDKPSAGSFNGVVVGVSPKKEILYKKTAEWDRYYKAAY